MLLPLSFAAISFFIDRKHLKKCKIIQKEKLDKLKKVSRRKRTNKKSSRIKRSQKRKIENLSKEEKLTLKNIIICTILLFFFKLFTAVFLSGNSSNASGIFHVLIEKKPVEETLINIGSFHSYSLDCERLILKEQKTIETIVLSIINKIFDSNPTNLETIKDKTDLHIESTANVKTESETKYNILDIDFDALLADDADEIIHQMDIYFKNRKPDKQNKYTGLFKGKNLIYITAESFASFAADPEITPTLYRMVHDGFYFKNFYTPYWEVSTIDGEYVNCLGLIPKSGTYSLKDSVKNHIPFALGNQFKKLGYKTLAYHNYLGSYYDRNLTHPHLGYTFISMDNGYRKTEKWPDSDLEMIQETINDYINEDKFHVYYMTISGHLPYNFWANAIAIKNKHLVENLPYDETVKAFYACNIELDRALAFLLEELNKKGKAEDTVIVLVADHYPYGLELSQHRRLMKSHVDVTFELYRNSLILFNPSQESCEIEKICSNMDIIPTISNLFALEYDSRLLMGNDIFSDTEPFVVFKSANVITDKLKYRSDTNVAVTFDGQTATAEEIEKIKKQLHDEVLFSRLILEKDYYRRVLPPEPLANKQD
jgi:hypothetical protein